jgi:hypothetical protein
LEFNTKNLDHQPDTLGSIEKQYMMSGVGWVKHFSMRMGTTFCESQSIGLLLMPYQGIKVLREKQWTNYLHEPITEVCGNIIVARYFFNLVSI